MTVKKWRARAITPAMPAVMAAVLFAAALAACTSLKAPVERLVENGQYLDWGKNPPGPADMARHEIRGPRPFEWWYFDGRLDTGETFVGTFQVPSFATGKPMVTFSLYGADWSKDSRIKALDPAEIRVSTTDVDITCPAGYVHRADAGTLRVGFLIGDIQADFTFTEQAPGWLPAIPAGINADTVDFFWAVHQGRSRVQGTIKRAGQAREVSGEGYADHNWGRKPLDKIARSWVWGRILSGDYTVIYADVAYRDPAVTSRPLYVASGDRMIVGTGSPRIREYDYVMHPALKRWYPTRIDIDFSRDDVSVSVQIRLKALVEEVDLLTLSGLGRFGQWAARTFVERPTYFRVIADYTGSIEEAGSRTHISGECLYEVMGFE